VTHDLDLSLGLIVGIIAVFFLLPFAMAWLEDSLHRPPGVNRFARWLNTKQYLPTRWGSRSRR